MKLSGREGVREGSGFAFLLLIDLRLPVLIALVVKGGYYLVLPQSEKPLALSQVRGETLCSQLNAYVQGFDETLEYPRCLHRAGRCDAAALRETQRYLVQQLEARWDNLECWEPKTLPKA